MPHQALSMIDIGRNALFYGGKWQAPFSDARIDVVNPADGSPLGSVVDANAQDVDAAVEAARRAFPAWRDLPPVERAKLMIKAANALRSHSDELAYLDALDAGLPIRMMANDVEMAASQIEYFAGLVRETKGDTLPMGPGSLNYSVREPLGVVVRIHPFNHPIMFAAAKVAPALAAGNVVIGKPADQTPLSALALAEIWKDIFPPSVFNLITGSRECGAHLVAHCGVAKVGVIGSVETGRAVMRSAADTLKKVTLELGGKNALIAYPDARTSDIAQAAVKGMNLDWTAGQSCGSTTRIFLHEAVHDAVVEEMKQLLSEIRLGPPTDPATEMGCLVSERQRDRVLSYVATAKQEGATLVCGGAAPEDPALAGGYFVLPTLFTDVAPGMTIAREEIFGPVMAVFRWSDEEQMLAEVNALDYGLAASIWTNDLATAHRCAAKTEAGYIWINGVGAHFVGAPFGGYKQSGLGREECLEDLLSYTQTKNVNLSLSRSP
ncbi:aldehyde dehydrogenase family protein [Amorphus sp. 3PC139-8]|uniref:aldehyde dehydrogenase family protein n=1 Tax=Amorphus sp. 3PC139-8 TaxID=2735676 RepID=UPI00345CCA2D